MPEKRRKFDRPGGTGPGNSRGDAPRGARAATATHRVEAAGDRDAHWRSRASTTSRVRDSKDPHGPALTFTARHWRGFTTAIKAHKLDLI